MGRMAGHHHAHGSAGRRALTVALVLIVGLMAGEVVFGVAAGSLALLADAGHMLTDAAALGLALAAAAYAGRPARGRWTFGFRRLEILAAHVERDHAPRRGRADRLHRRPPARLSSGGSGRAGARRGARGDGGEPDCGARARRAEPREPERARRLPARDDRSSRVHRDRPVAGAVILATGWDQADPIASLVVAALIFWSSCSLLRESTRILLDVAPRAAPRDRRRDARRARGRRGARPARLDRRERVPVGLRHTCSCEPGADCHALRRELGGAPRRALLARALDAPGRARGVRRHGLPASAGRSETSGLVRSAIRDGRAPSGSKLSRVAGLEGKTAIVTGASSGIGAATARALADNGARVAGGARRVEQLQTEVALELDVTDPSSCERFVEQAVDGARRPGHPRQQRGPRPWPRAVRPEHGGGRGDRPRDERPRRDAPDAPVPAVHPRRRPHRQPRLGRRPPAVREAPRSTSRPSSPLRGFTYALREDLLGRPIHVTTVDPGLVETNFSRVRFRGDEERAKEVYANVRGR